MSPQLSGMKKILILLVFLLILTPVFAEKMILKEGNSYSDEAKNITLLKIENNKALFCVNNEKGIIAKDKRADINGVIIEFMRNFEDKSAKFDIVVPNCYKCVCGPECSNSECVERQIEIEQQPINKTEPKSEIIQTQTIQPSGVSVISLIAVILILLVASMGVYVLWKRYQYR